MNSQGLQSGEGMPFTARIVARIQRNYQLTPRYDRLRKAGMLTRAALGKYQKANGLKLDCWPTQSVLDHMRK